MADLFDRLFPASPGEDNIAVHYFWASIVDYTAGETSRAEIIAYWNLDAEAQTDLGVLCDALDGMSVAQEVVFLQNFHAVMNIAEGGAKYATKAAFRARLGL